jgi:hypothetical protein
MDLVVNHLKLFQKIVKLGSTINVQVVSQKMVLKHTYQIN